MARLKTLGSRIKEGAGSRVTVLAPGSWRSGMTSTQRGYDYRWQKARERHLRTNPLCTYCARAGRTAAASVVDHIIPHRGDQALFWDEDNWQSLCGPCHSSDKQAEEAAGALT
ncbi:HNH endonuclease [Pseudomonas monteilii]|uniref:HNH endonuclease n=1 Tax=Pseudomonas monteilii TaxID=76759 RepID=UPI001E62FCB8|nr:HNH endonuclease signature motif containing protein [Pseudomonas monteilii]WJO30990.1 HNH endonuclease signature motif containing protein [Pseudomonas monteilii]